MKRKTAQFLAIFILSLPVFYIFLPEISRTKFYVFKIEKVLLLLFYIYISYSYLIKKPIKIFTSPPPHNLIRESIFISFLSSLAINIWFYREAFLGIAIIEWFNKTIALPIFNNIFIQPQNLLASQIGFLAIFLMVLVIICILSFRIYKIDETTEKKLFLRFRSLIIYLSLLSILTCLFSSELFQIKAGDISSFFTGGTEDYIRYRIRNGLSFIEDLKKFGGFNYGIFPKETGDRFTVYLSQTGFWGAILKLFQSTFSIDPEIFLLGTRITLSLIYSNILLWIGHKLKQRFGLIASVIFIVPQVFTYWILGPVKHLIWFYPLLFAPFLHSLIRYPKVIVKEISQKRFLIEGLIIFMLVFLRGYTYLSNIILSAMVPVLYFELQNKTKLKQVIKILLPIGVVGIISLSIVLVIHLIQLTLYLGGISEAANYFIQRTVQRTGFQETISYWQLFKKWINVRFFYFPKTELFVVSYWENLSIKITFGTIHYLFFFVLFITAYLKTKANKITNLLLKNKIQILYWVGISTLFAMFASWSWFINKGHMEPHYHMNGIMYIIPFGFCFFIFIGIFVQTLLEYLGYLSIKEVSEN